MATESNISTSTSSPELHPIGVDEHTIASMLGISVQAVRADRYGPKRIPFFKFGDSVRYTPSRVATAMLAFEQGGEHLKRTRRSHSQK